MGLRSRLALLLVAAVVPFAIVLALLQGALLRRNAALAIGEAIGSQFVGNAQARCEDDPYGFQHGRRGPPTERRSKRHIDRAGPPHRAPAARGGRLYAFDDSLVPARADAPRLPEVVASAIRRGEEIAWATDDLGGRGEQLLVAVRVANEGACAVVVAMRPVEAQPLSLTLGPALAVSGFAVLLTVLAAGPLVRRVRRLTTAVRRARGGEDVELPIEGGDELTELARALAEDRSELAAKVDALRRRDEALTSFVANTTHDVMIPLTVLQNDLLTLEERSQEGTEERGLAVRALGEAHYLGSILQNLSASAKLDAIDRPFERIDVDLVAVSTGRSSAST